MNVTDDRQTDDRRTSIAYSERRSLKYTTAVDNAHIV